MGVLSSSDASLCASCSTGAASGVLVYQGHTFAVGEVGARGCGVTVVSDVVWCDL